jgi:hypothetical protein
MQTYDRRAFVRTALLGGTAATLGACANGPGVFGGLGKDAMGMLVFYRTDDLPLTEDQYKALVLIAKKRKVTIDYQLSGPWEAGASGFFAYGAAGAGGGATQGLFYNGAAVGPAAGYTAAVYGLGGLVNGLITASYAEAFAVAKAVQDTIDDIIKYDGEKGDIFKRVHVAAAFIRSLNTSTRPAAMPADEFHGGANGTPAQ